MNSKDLVHSSLTSWSDQYEYLTKRFHELSLDQILETSGDSMHRLKEPLLKKMRSEDYLATLEEDERRDRIRARVQGIYDLLRDREFFTERQREVLSLLFGWNGSQFVGPKTISDIAKLLGIAQPVAFNHLRLAIKKLKKHFGTAEKKVKVPKPEKVPIPTVEITPIVVNDSSALDIN